MIQVIDSIPWVRCASGNVLLRFDEVSQQDIGPPSFTHMLVGMVESTSSIFAIAGSKAQNVNYNLWAADTLRMDCLSKRLSHGCGIPFCEVQFNFLQIGSNVSQFGPNWMRQDLKQYLESKVV